MLRKVIFAMMAALILIVPAFAQTSTGTTEEMITVPKSSLTPEQLQVAQTRQATDMLMAETGKYAEFVGLGKAVGVGMREGLEALTDTADKFSKTQVGHFTMFLIAYKILGTDLIQFLIGVPMFIVGTIVIIWSYRKNCIPYRIKIEDEGWGKPKKWELTKPDNAGDSYYLWGHFVVWLIVVIAASFVTFS